jgi:hypothetical protein
MAYGIVSMTLHRRLPLELAYLGFVLLSALLFGLVRLKNRRQIALRPYAEGLKPQTALGPEA